ncbi:hypothetical protein LSCM1_06748 [Leishmania martiniquensis]|uniref:Uncharacterized protein n=1 Tax=Leishmania martiniquensis TaxID=1580590 RepID=A0A836KSG9_9TRYP|nr:hypothetical protein LSCM1_06748 [Leishmania martiniquensis]
MSQLEDYRLMEPSPSPPATEWAPLPGSHARDSLAHGDTHSNDRLWSASGSPSSPPSPLLRDSAQRTQSCVENSTDPTSSEVDLASLLQSRARRGAMHCQGTSQRHPGGAVNLERTGPMCVIASASGPLSAYSLNALPKFSCSKRRTGALAAVPAPCFNGEEDGNSCRVTSGITMHVEVEEEEQQRLTQPAVPRRPSSLCTQRNRVSRSSGSGSSTSCRRRSSVLGPDPRDCIDLYNGDAMEGEARVTPLPYGQRQQAAPALDYDLAALVNAGTVDRCRSDSRGQVDLISKDSAEGVAKEAVDTCERIESAPGAYHDGDGSADVDASYEFVQEYFYYPAASPEIIRCHERGDGTTSGLSRAETPRRSVSGSSPSSSVPRWVLSLTEETPFTPFALSATGAATASSPFLHVGPARRATATTVSPTAEERLTQGDIGTCDGAQQQQQMMMMPIQRLTAHELVAAVLSSSPCTAAASDTEAPARAAAPTPMAKATAEAEAAAEGQPEEPLPQRPPDCEEETLVERERLCRRVHDTRVRLARVQQLLARFNVVVAARQAKLAALREEQAVLAHQAESYTSRAAIANREVRRLRERQHGHDEVRLLCSMLSDKENRLRVAQSQLLSLQSMWKQLRLLHSATAEESSGDGASHLPCLSMLTTHESAAGVAQAAGSAEDPQEEEAPPSPASSVASLDTCNAVGDFLDELLGEVEELAKVCIQLPPAPSAAALSSCEDTGLQAAKHCSGAADQGPQRAQTSRSHPTYTALNRRLNDGNNGFFSFFGGATEAHLDSKPLSTFLANLDRLARTSWEREEELQLRARELATEEEEEHLKARLALEYDVRPQQPQTPQRLSGSIDRRGCTREMKARALLSSAEEAEYLCDSGADGASVLNSTISFDASPSDAMATAAAATNHATHQLSLSSPEHGRRSRGSSAGQRMPNGTARSPLSASSSLLHHRATPAPFLLPTLVYAYPRVASVSQRLDAMQQQIQADYAAAIEAERQGRRQLTTRLRDTYRQYVAPVLRRAIDALRREQTSLVRQLAELGVKAVLIQWEEEEEEDAVDDAALLRAIDGAEVALQKTTYGRQRCGATKGRSRSRANEKVCAGEEGEDSYGDAVTSRCTSLARSENGWQRRGAAATPLPRRVYRRTLRVACAAALQRGSPEGEGEAEVPVSSRPPSDRHACDSGRNPRPSTTRHRRSSARPRSAPGYLSAQSTGSDGSLAATSSKACAALQLCTYSPMKGLFDQSDAPATAEETEGRAVATVVGPTTAPAGRAASLGRALASTTVTPIATASVRCSGGTPCASCTARASAATRASTAVCSGRSSRERASAVMPSSARQSFGCTAASRRSATSHRHRCSRPRCGAMSALVGEFEAPSSSPPSPVVEDVRELVVASDSAFAASTRVTMATPMAADVWSPFAHTRKPLSDGAVRVVLTFIGGEARRRQAAQARREAHQREFWELREELARVDEDIFQLRTRWNELQRIQQSTAAEHRAKLVEAEAKVRKCRAFYESLRQENKDWQAIRGKLEQAVLGKGDGRGTRPH